MAVYAAANVALARQLLEELFEFAFAPADDGREDHHPFAALRGGLAFLERHDGGDDLLGALAGNWAAAAVAVGRSDRSVEQAQVIVNLRDCPDGGARAAACGLLLDGDGGAQAFNRVHVRPLHLVEELAGVGRKRLDVSALAFRVNDVERQARFPRAGEPRDHRQRPPRNLHADVFQIVLPRAPYRDSVNHQNPSAMNFDTKPTSHATREFHRASSQRLVC